jgi:hypothetical protein
MPYFRSSEQKGEEVRRRRDHAAFETICKAAPGNPRGATVEIRPSLTAPTTAQAAAESENDLVGVPAVEAFNWVQI